ncbi:hypothetical protein BV22DRAFT_1030839 [Leucogyrophana mollusca]|uniref:Uncharacterized protein n=1 Tax=Leucogyrophana mollusca TaxID=85980 RepID=A0ACB8BSB6_9AGAM|nr:hypothetical protein BV22DRAFT_1030839 [Leucogyrophana mollusca]
MKRGFLNTSKAKRAAATANPPTEPQRPKSPGVILGGRDDPLPPELEQFSLGTDIDAIDFHQLPPQILDDLRASGDDRTRKVFRAWPRDPKGKIIVPSPLRGKEASNGLNLWGRTLYDFFHVHRKPGQYRMRTTSTGSRLAKQMRLFGELEAAKNEIAWADQEEDPQELFPCDIGELISDVDGRVHMGLHENDSMRQAPIDDTNEKEARENSAGKGKDKESSQQSNPSTKSSTQSAKSIFDPSNYPAPWPLIPGASSCPRLQTRLPLHLLPRKLIVHDPWNLLSVHYVDNDFHTPWNEKRDIIRTYSLHLSDEGKAQAEKSLIEAIRANAEAQAKWDAGERDNLIFTSNPAAGLNPGVFKGPVINAILPQRPTKLLNVPEAHLYIAPKFKLGRGHHSVVYRAELELPRSLFFEDKICERCVEDQVQVFVRTVEAKTRKEGKPSDLEKLHADVKIEAAPASPGSRYLVPTSGTVLQFFPKIQYQQQFTCVHGGSYADRSVPLTARVEVAAKLSIEDDPHLAREADNYQAFPGYLFEHYNGYNIVPPLHDPVPVGAVVPQFYGHYLPDPIADQPNTRGPDTTKGSQAPKDSEGEDSDAMKECHATEHSVTGDSDAMEGSHATEHPDAEDSDAMEVDDDPAYLSPILLLEHCGIPIVPKKLNMDDKQECASLLFRFHHAGWLHGSFAARNILVQSGPLTDWPTVRIARNTPSFRMIDFGRSSLISDGGLSRAGEEGTGLQLCRLHHFAGGGLSGTEDEDASH